MLAHPAFSPSLSNDLQKIVLMEGDKVISNVMFVTETVTTMNLLYNKHQKKFGDLFEYRSVLDEEFVDSLHRFLHQLANHQRYQDS